jgi:hypothetical protein
LIRGYSQKEAKNEKEKGLDCIVASLILEGIIQGNKTSFEIILCFFEGLITKSPL